MELAAIYITCADIDEARRLGEALVAERLAACTNALAGMTSCYRWQGEIHHDQECVLIAKTRRSLVDEVGRRVRQLHSYETPCVVALPIIGGDADFLSWIVESTKDI